MRALPLVAVTLLAVGLTGCSGDPDLIGDQSQAQEEAPAEGAGFESPLPAGSTVEVADWTVTFGETTPDATDYVLTENEFGDPPVSGNQFVMLTVGVVYVGAEPVKAPWADLYFDFAGADGTVYESTSDDGYCGFIPSDLNELPETEANTELAGNVCVSVPSAQVEGGTWVLSDLFDEQIVYVAQK